MLLHINPTRQRGKRTDPSLARWYMTLCCCILTHRIPRWRVALVYDLMLLHINPTRQRGKRTGSLAGASRWYMTFFAAGVI